MLRVPMVVVTVRAQRMDTTSVLKFGLEKFGVGLRCFLGTGKGMVLLRSVTSLPHTYLR